MMPIENATKIEDLNELWPLNGDGVSEGDNHIRNVKKVLKTDVASLSEDNAFAGQTTFGDTVKIQGGSAFLELRDTNEGVADALDVAVKFFGNDGVEVGHIGHRDQKFLRVQSNIGSVWFEADEASLADVVESEVFKWFHRNVDIAGLSSDGDLRIKRLRLTSTADVTLGSTNEPFRIGSPDFINLAIDTNEIQAREGGGASGLMINPGGGGVNIGNASSIIELNGRATVAFGTSGAPSLCFDGDNDTGIYRGSSNLLCVTGGGSLRGRFDAAGPSVFNKDTVINREKGDNRYQAKSSKRFKEKIGEVAIGTSSILDLMQPKSFVWGGELPDSAEEKGCAAFGLIAEEVERFFPEAVTYQWHNPKQTKDANGEEKSDVGGPKRVLGLDPLALIGVLIDEVKTLKTRVADLESGGDVPA